MDEARHFLESLFPEAGPDRLIQIWWAPAKDSATFPDAEHAAACAMKRAEDSDVYCGVGLSPRSFGLKGRCPAGQIAGIGGLWADIDVADDGRHPASVEIAQQFGSSLIVPPSFTINSGHGIHLWWLLKEPWFFDTDADRQRAALLARDWIGTIQSWAGERGWRCDSVFDLARLMRVPGTMNRKETPVPVSILEENWFRYDPSDFIEYCIPSSSPLSTTRVEQPVSVVVHQQESLPAKFDLLMQMNAKVRATWEHRRVEFPSLSEYDQALARLCANAGFADQEIADVLVAHRKIWDSEKNKGERLDYLQRTIGTARIPVNGAVRAPEKLTTSEREESQEESNGRNREVSQKKSIGIDREEAHEESDDGNRESATEKSDDEDRESATEKSNDGDRTEPLDGGWGDEGWGEGELTDESEQGPSAITALLGFSVDALGRYKLDPKSNYFARSNGNTVFFGSADALIQQPSFRAKMTDLGSSIPHKLEADDWDVLSCLFPNATPDMETAPEGTYAGRMHNWITSYVSKAPRELQRADAEALTTTEQPFRAKGRIFTFASGLLHHVNVTLGQACSIQDATLCLAAMGCRPDILDITLKGYGSGIRRNRRSCWEIPLELIESEGVSDGERES